MVSFTEDMQAVITNQRAIDDLRTSVSDTNSEIGKIGRAWELGITDTETAVPQLKTLFDQLNTDSGKIMDEIYNNIVNAISGSFGVALIDAGYSVENVLSLLRGIRDEGKTTLASLADDMAALNKQMDSGKITEDEYGMRYDEILTKMNDLVNQGRETKDVFAEVKESIGNINWKTDIENGMIGTKQAFGDIGESALNAKADIETYYKGVIDNLESMKQFTTDPARKIQLDEMIQVAEGAKQKDLDQISANLAQMFDFMQQDMIAKGAKVASDAAEQWDKFDPFEKWKHGGSLEGYVAEALVTYQNKVMKPILSDMDTQMQQAGIDGSTYASDAMTTILTSMFDYGFNGAGGYVAGFKRELSEDTKARLAEYGIDATEWGAEAGISMTQGVLSGAQTSMQENKKSWLDWSIWPWNWFKEKNEINSPSALFERGGENIMQGLWNGIKSKWEELKKMVVKT